MLMQFEDNWIDPKTITAVRPMESSGEIPPRVAIHHGDGFIQIIYCETYAQATTKAAQLASIINDVQAGIYDGPSRFDYTKERP